jgi:xylulokinase
MASVYFLGIDIGTSGAKAILTNQFGRVIAASTNKYPMYNTYPLWCEQNPDDWWKAVQKSIREIISLQRINPEEIKGIGLTGQMHGLVTLDVNGNSLYPCIMWNDQRTSEECEEITSIIGFEKLLSVTGNPVLPGFTAPKILWLKKYKPDIYSRIHKILLPKDYIRLKLTNEFISDVSDASGTSLLDVKRRNWSNEILTQLDIPVDWLPLVLESKEISGKITKEAALKTGLKEGTHVIAGAGDQAAGAVGCGAVKEGLISITLGTSGVVFTSSNIFRIEPEGKLHAFCHALPDRWHLMGVTLSAAGSFQWLKETFFNDVSYDLLTKSAETILPGSEGLIYLPYLSGERTPYPDPNAKGTFIGITLRHNKSHFVRALLEGVSFSMKDCYQLISNIGIVADKIIISGGGAKSELWKSIIADLFGVEINTLNSTEGAPYGAAILAAVGTGFYDNIDEACGAILKIESSILPDKNNYNLYNDYYSLYTELYPALKTSFNNISRLTKKYNGS